MLGYELLNTRGVSCSLYEWRCCIAKKLDPLQKYGPPVDRARERQTDRQSYLILASRRMELGPRGLLLPFKLLQDVEFAYNMTVGGVLAQ